MAELRIEAGKWYRDASGRKWYCVGRRLPDSTQWVFVDAAGMCQCHQADGKSTVFYPAIVAEWVDEPTDAEIADALRFELSSGVYMSWDGDSFTAVPWDRCMQPTTRLFVDAVNAYRKEHE